MRLFFDESGDFSFPENRYDAYTQAAVICPDSQYDLAHEYVADRCEAWDVEEIHAVELDDAQTLDVCEFIRASPFRGIVVATDTAAVTLKSIADHRLAQAVRIHENKEQWLAAGGNSVEIEDWYEKRLSAIAYEGRVGHAEWVQADYLVTLIHRALNKTIVSYYADEWRPDFEGFRFVIDAKLTGKRAKGEKYLDDVLLPLLGSNRGRMDLIGVIEWKDPPIHPFERNFRADEFAVDLRKLFANGLEFAASHEHPGLQLADLVAYTARRRVMDPSDEAADRAWRTIRPCLTTLDHKGLHILRYASGGEDADVTRYEGM